MQREVLQKSAINLEPRGRLDTASFIKNVDFQTFLPPNDLALFVEHFWSIRSKRRTKVHFSDQLMHRPYVDIFLSFESCGIQGTFCRKRQYIATDETRIVGARFRPGAFHLFYDGSMLDLRDTTIDLKKVLPKFDSNFCQQLLKGDDQSVFSALIDHLRKNLPKKDAKIALIGEIIELVEASSDIQTVAEIAKIVGKSERWLQQLFQEYIGIGLKWFLQTRRSLEAADRIRNEDVDWVALAYDTGYSSQQHFITDFRQAISKTPKQYKMELDED